MMIIMFYIKANILKKKRFRKPPKGIDIIYEIINFVYQLC